MTLIGFPNHWSGRLVLIVELLKIEPVKRYSLDNETLLSRCSKQTLKLALTCVKSFKNNMENISRITDCIEDSEASQVSSDGEMSCKLAKRVINNRCYGWKAQIDA